MKSANVIEYDKEVYEAANKRFNRYDRVPSYNSTSNYGFIIGAKYGSTESPVIKRLESALKSLVGFEPFNSLEPRKASEALAYLNEIRESVK